MNQIRKLVNWLLKAWPFIIVFCISVIHHKVLTLCLPDTAEKTNQAISAFMQIVGGLIVLSTINSNLGLFGKDSLLSKPVNWLKSFPLFRKSQGGIGSINGTLSGLTCSAEGHESRVFYTIEEKVEEAQRQIDEIRKILYRKESELLSKINEVGKKLLDPIDKNQNDINTLNGILAKTAIGSLNTQVFGVLLVIYGALSPLIC